jgi:3'-phosphoadenosine 5'-phosphosulfate sulfotransferase (PAPS reductase)/FAD synthetase
MTSKKPNKQIFDDKSCRHILSLSGGKDSTALALYMRDRVQNLEYVFCDTEKELKETYRYLEKLEVYLGKKIQRITPDVGFDDLLEKRRNFLPSPQIRWCTEYLKIKPFEKFIGDDNVIMYIGIRADESHRTGYISTKPNIKRRFPFIEDGLRLRDILHIIGDSQIGLPEYYKWRSRSGCYFCFFQQRREWIGLLETHPVLFKQAMKYERKDPVTGEMYTWVQGESLADLARPQRVSQIKAEYEKRRANEQSVAKESPLLSVFEKQFEDEHSGCIICHL